MERLATFIWKLLTKDSSKKANCYTHKDIEDIANVIKESDSVTATDNCVNNSITDMANGSFKIFLEKL